MYGAAFSSAVLSSGIERAACKDVWVRIQLGSIAVGH